MTWRVSRTQAFDDWLRRLKDNTGKAIITQRITRLTAGQIGDSKMLGDGLAELRIDFGPGYRLYYVRHGEALIVLLCGGDKGSQARDIARAKAMAKDV